MSHKLAIINEDKKQNNNISKNFQMSSHEKIKQNNIDFINQMESKLDECKKLLEEAQNMSRFQEEAIKILKDNENVFLTDNCINYFENILEENIKLFINEDIDFIHFRNICCQLKDNEESINKIGEWIKCQCNKKGASEVVVHAVLIYLTGLLLYKGTEKIVTNRATKIVRNLIDYCGENYNEYENMLLKMKRYFSIFFYVTEFQNKDVALEIGWDVTLLKSLCPRNKIFDELLSKNKEIMLIEFEEFKKEAKKYESITVSEKCSFLVKEETECYNKDKIREWNIIIDECSTFIKEMKANTNCDFKTESTGLVINDIDNTK